MCIFVTIFNNKDKIKIFIFPHFGLNIHHTFLYFVTLKGFVFVIGKELDKESWNFDISKTKTVLWYFCHITHPYFDC